MERKTRKKKIDSFALETTDDIVGKAHLLDRFKVIKDRVWDRVWLTELEIHMTDQKEFQRLHWVLQLGSAVFVYPSATHTRFEHSLGTVEVAQLIVNHCNDNSERYGTSSIGLYATLLVRLGALLHDFAQMPNAHAFDDEGHLFKVEYKCETLAERILGESGIVAKVMEGFLEERFKKLGLKTKSSDFAKQIVDDLRWVLVDVAKTGEEKAVAPKDREFLRYVADIIGNTICADLIDYVLRDFISVGFGRFQRLRPLEFFVVKKFEGLPRLVLALWKPQRGEKMRPDIVSDVIEYLNMRYTLAESVYFHHAKMAAASMLIKAVNIQNLSCDDIWEHSDHSFLKLMAGDGANGTGEETPEGQVDDKENTLGRDTPKGQAAHLAGAILSRQLYKLAHEIGYREDAKPGGLEERVKRDYAFSEDAASNQRQMEKSLAEIAGIPEDSITVYCPDPDMNLKAFEALVWPVKDSEPRLLEEVTRRRSRELMEKHRRLWKLAIFVEREHNSPEVRRAIREGCDALFLGGDLELGRLIETYMRRLREPLKEELGTMTLDELDLAEKFVASKLSARARRTSIGLPSIGLPSIDDIVQHLRSARERAG